ncbi:putative mitochondrial tricarboxylate carrier [Leptomonas pyrrhocoris]|uniref:Sidoreflexin n=1 Tax=Leptomonas pyrrhocoris TaxID=157538 RepID=A0A0M9FQ66_LEPPY|nr:putative mitochondrial tricarboxylate carrier [Leptomonas pyrrhocoris]XP_015652172.1 putative mitochondrial tricarboxylate carrier [Leptomonas pyrrhocoris]KPA73732.1 putative mitochondrial tricarboxylate carrier [Leptomonas pyrrhocoris]KPA73733.1 putative mitochondrial tricarboxylate carrier [Leptomonas pyrrhocoris]|eukprot:XP_015652171.1 putative mitochondrial tricarboxylate carrier [Leptomonas pyrrhocoris]
MAPPPFSMERTKYDMSSFWGRTRYWAESISPVMLLENERTLQKAQMLLDRWKDGQAGNASDAELWHARMAVESCIHPTTKEVLSPVFRMSMFLPMNYFVVPVMMMPSTVMSISRTIAIQWFNQSYNSAVNYANRSSDAQPASEIAKAYTAAVVVACGGSLTATMWLKRVPTGTVKATLIRASVPYLAVSCAAVVNLASMRKNEWLSSGEGIRVVDEDGRERGTSTAAGFDSLKKCSATRVIWNLPCMVLPTLCMMPLLRVSRLARRHSVATESFLQMLGISIGVPPALAAYALTQTIPATKLEPRLQNLTREDGSPVQNFTYYKGL